MSPDGRSLLFTIDADWIPGSGSGLERLLDLCAEMKLRATIFVTGKFALAHPELIQGAYQAGHAIGVHGWEHPMPTFQAENYRSTTVADRREWLLRAGEAIARVINHTPRAFRAPYLWIDGATFRLLDELGYAIDSSIPTRRFDGLIGVTGYSDFFWASQEPYHPDPDDPARPGNSPLLEVPPSAFLLPLNMSTLRFFGLRVSLTLARLLSRRCSILNFYCHPWEFVRTSEMEFPTGSPSRHMRGIGPHLVGTLAAWLDGARALGYQSRTILEVASCVSP